MEKLNDMKNYIKAKKKYFKSKVEYYNLFIRNKLTLSYYNGLYQCFDLRLLSDDENEIINDILHSYNFQAFFKAYTLSCVNGDFKIYFGVVRRSVSYTFTH